MSTKYIIAKLWKFVFKLLVILTIFLDFISSRHQGPGNMDQGTGNRDQNTGIREQGSGYRDQDSGNRKL